MAMWGLNLGGGIEGLLNLNSAGQNYAYLYDGKGNVEAVIDSAQAVVAAYRYDPFGVLLAKTGSFEQPFGFSTKRYNARIGMVQYEARNYLPEWGRWDRRDPLGEAGGLNLYAFVGNNPVNWVDPWGLIVLPADVGGMIRHNQEIQSAMDFLPQFLLNMWFPTTYEGLVSNLSSDIMGLACPISTGVSPSTLLEKASQPYNQFLTNVGKALSKHPEVIGLTKATLRKILRSDPAMNKAAREALELILEKGALSFEDIPRYGGVIQYKIPGGFGARWYAETGEFIGFINP